MRKCTLIIPDAGPINSLWVAGQLDLLLVLEMTIIMVDAVYDELTSDLRYPKDADVKAFIDGNQPPFVIEETDIGCMERGKRAAGLPLKKNAGELAIVDFMSSDHGLRKYLQSNEPVLVLFEDSYFHVLQKPPNMHLLSTMGMLRGLERLGIIESAEQIRHEMTHPTLPGRKLNDVRSFSEQAQGIDEPAAIGSFWEPKSPY